MLRTLKDWDRELFIWLNSLGIEHYDSFWLFVTQIESWLPLFLLFFILIFYCYGLKKGFVVIFFLLLSFSLTLSFTNLVKEYVARLRPNNLEALSGIIRILQKPTNYSFFSGHAAVSMALTTFVVLALRHQLKWIYVIYIWPLLFMTSRIYVGVHFPGDIMVGSLVGVVIGLALWKSAGRRWIQFA